jgi:hypothetical protein
MTGLYAYRYRELEDPRPISLFGGGAVGSEFDAVNKGEVIVEEDMVE